MGTFTGTRRISSIDLYLLDDHPEIDEFYQRNPSTRLTRRGVAILLGLLEKPIVNDQYMTVIPKHPERLSGKPLKWNE